MTANAIPHQASLPALRRAAAPVTGAGDDCAGPDADASTLVAPTVTLLVALLVLVLVLDELNGNGAITTPSGNVDTRATPPAVAHTVGSESGVMVVDLSVSGPMAAGLRVAVAAKEEREAGKAGAKTEAVLVRVAKERV